MNIKFYKSLKKLILFIGFLTLCWNNHAFNSYYKVQQNQDSIISQIQKLKEGAAKLYTQENVFNAIEKLENALKIYEDQNITNNTLLFGLYVDLSNAYGNESIRNEEKRLIFVNKAKAISQNYDVNAYDLINFYISLGSIEDDEHNNIEALGYITKAFTILKKRESEVINEIGKNPTIKLNANLLEWFVSLHFTMGNETELLKAHKKLESFYKEHSNHTDLKFYFAQGSFRVGRFYQPNDASKAEIYFNKAEEKGDNNIKLYANICKGFAFLNAKEFKKVPAIIKKLESFDNLNRFQELNIHEIAARCYSETNNIPKLIEHTNKALLLLNDKEIAIDVLNFNTEDFSPITQLKYPILLNQYAQFLEQTKGPQLVDTAMKLFKIGLKQFDERIDRQPIANHYINYNIIKNRNLKLLINKKDDSEIKQILAQIERIENRASLNQLLLNRSLASQKSKLDTLLTQEISLREEITDLKQKQVANDTILNQQLFELNLKLKQINENIVQENPIVHNLNTIEFTFDNLNLDEQTHIIKFLKAEDDLFRVSILDEDISVKLLGHYKPFTQKIDSFLLSIKNFKEISNYNSISEQLYNDLLGDLTISPATVIITDVGLRHLPFELLKHNESYLIEKTSISYATGLSYLNTKLYDTNVFEHNATFFAPSYSKFTPSETELAVRGSAYDLEGAREEVRVLSELANGIVFEDEQASKSQFFNLSINSSILHLAGHAFLNDKDPELSNIVFSDNEENNKLFISELYGFKSNSKLAVLSACNTGVGGYEDGKGLVSLSEAFMYSGIPSTVSSLWSAPDQSTKKIMVSFYKYLKEGLPKSKALQQAKLDYLKTTTNTKLKHPYYWAGFVLYGEDSPIKFSETKFALYYWVIGISILLLLVFIFKLRRKKNSQSL